MQIKDGEYTKTIYNMIKEQRYTDTIQLLNILLDSYSNVSKIISIIKCNYLINGK